MSDSAAIEKADLKVEVEESSATQKMFENYGTAAMNQDEHDEFRENSVMTDNSITGEKLEEMKMEQPQLILQEMKFAKVEDAATDDKDEKEMLSQPKLEYAMLKKAKSFEEMRGGIAKMEEEATDERTLTRNNAAECSETVGSETNEQMRERLVKMRKEVQDKRQKERQEMTLEIAKLEKEKEEIDKRERARKEHEKLEKEKKEMTTKIRLKHEKLQKEVQESATTTREIDEYEELQKKKAMSEESVTTEIQITDKCEESEKMKPKLEESATKVRTKTKIAELKTEIRATEARKRDIDSMLQVMAIAQAVDLCFLVDCTGSMESYIQGVKEKIQTIIAKANRMLPDLNFSVAFVGYRDHCDGADRTVVLDFTTSILEFQSFMGSVEAKGGGDTSEDVFGGIEEVTKLSWSKQTRTLFHIADCPCHGTRFHDPGVGDDYPDGDPRGLKIENLLSKVEELKIIYWFAKLGNQTDLMIQVFQSIMKITQIDLASVNNLVDAVACSISASVNIYEQYILEEQVKQKVKGELVPYKLVTGQPDWSALGFKDVTVWKNKIPFDLSDFQKPLEVLCEPKRSIKIATDPFAKGATRIVYYGMDCTGGEEEGNIVVLKQFLYADENQLNLYKEQMEIQSVTIALANKFNSIKPAGTRDVQFANVSTVTVTDGGKQKHLSMERYIPGKYVKFNNNAGFVNETDYTATLNAFSHWTYLVTGKYLMVVDLQGVKEESSGEVRYVLTDPAIHCAAVLRFGKTNFGRKGMHKFFRTHYCNSICKAMALKFHRLQPMKVYTADFAGATVVS